MLTTLAGYLLRLNFTIVAFLYLILVSLLSLAGSFLTAVLVSLIAVGCLAYFFTDPALSFHVSSQIDIIAIFSFLLTALIITRLVAKVRSEMRASGARHRRLEGLYRLSQKLLALKPETPGGKNLIKEFVGSFGITAVCLFDGETAEMTTAGNPSAETLQVTRDAYVLHRDIDQAEQRRSARCLNVGAKTSGAVGFEGLEDFEVAGTLMALTVTFQERVRASQRASESAATTATEAYRSAILDALAHEFRTPLTTILAAAGGIREAGPLNEAQSEMAETVESETVRLGSLTARLLRMARLDRDEIRPRLDVIDFAALVNQVVTQQSRIWSDREIRLQPGGAPEVVADPELLRLAVSQLIENACKYSLAGASIDADLRQENGTASLVVTNRGKSIPAAERERVFERFYRGADVRRTTPGSGLGLFVARKIALAHGGSLDLMEGTGDSVNFRLRIPCPLSDDDAA